jgi:Spy/CpxP family protein refolding chaperone
MKKSFKVTAAIVGVILVGGLLSACHPRHGYHGDPERIAARVEKHIDRVLSKIDATEDQTNQIHLIVGQVIEDARQMHEQGAATRGTVAAELFSDTPDREWLHQRVDEKAKEMAAFSHRTVDRLIDISAVLTPEQRVELHQRFADAHAFERQ